MLKKLVCVIGAAFLTVVSGANAFAQISNPQQLYQTITASTITDLMTELGVATAVSQLEDGSVLILANVAPGKVLMLGLQACGNAGGGGCKEMAMISVDPFVDLPYPTALENLVLMNIVNRDFEFGGYFFDVDDNIPMATRFEVFEYGVSKGNLFWTIASMVNFSNSFFTLLSEIRIELEASQVSSAVPLLGDRSEVSSLYTSISRGQHAGSGLPGVFGSSAFRTLLNSKNFVEEVSWTIHPDEQGPSVFHGYGQQRGED